LEVIIYNSNYLDIPLQDLPVAGNLIVCHDPQKRLNCDNIHTTWAVVETISNKGEVPPRVHGLFGEQKYAVIFAQSVANMDKY
jgi:hypothetical protein